MLETRIWHKEQKTQDCTEYYVLIQDGDKTISVILKHDASKNAIQSDMYVPPDIDYTIHDACNHQGGECFEDYPDSREYQDVYMSDRYHYTLKQLQDLEAQVKQARIADELRADKKAITQ